MKNPHANCAGIFPGRDKCYYYYNDALSLFLFLTSSSFFNSASRPLQELQHGQPPQSLQQDDFPFFLRARFQTITPTTNRAHSIPINGASHDHILLLLCFSHFTFKVFEKAVYVDFAFVVKHDERNDCRPDCREDEHRPPPAADKVNHH